MKRSTTSCVQYYERNIWNQINGFKLILPTDQDNKYCTFIICLDTNIGVIGQGFYTLTLNNLNITFNTTTNNQYIDFKYGPYHKTGVFTFVKGCTWSQY